MASFWQASHGFHFVSVTRSTLKDSASDGPLAGSSEVTTMTADLSYLMFTGEGMTLIVTSPTEGKTRHHL